jgi:UDP-2,3-diacylglucosamine hydrolase
MNNTNEPIGLIAGWGRFPIIFAEKARDLGHRVVCIGVRGMADEAALRPLVYQYHRSRVANMGWPIRCFKRAGVTKWTAIGKIHKRILFSRFRWLTLCPDLRMIRFWLFGPRASNADDDITRGILREFASEGLINYSALDLCPELLVREGILTRRRPSASQWNDIRYGWELARKMGELDVGQSVMVKDRAVLAVEAIEGTDEAIRRAGVLCPVGGFAVVKVAKPQQDRRFDVPTVGPLTIETMKQAGGGLLAIEAGRTIILDEARTLELADRYGIVIASCDEAALQAKQAA